MFTTKSRQNMKLEGLCPRAPENTNNNKAQSNKRIPVIQVCQVNPDQKFKQSIKVSSQNKTKRSVKVEDLNLWAIVQLSSL